MPFDAVVTNPGRLSILTALAVEDQQNFVHLRQRTRLTDGNLASHAKRLASAGLIEIHKSFQNGKPLTSLTLTLAGRSALESHARRLMAAISYRRVGDAVGQIPERSAPPVKAAPAVPVPSAAQGDDWVD